MSERLQEVGGLLIALTGAGLSLADACAKAEIPEPTAKTWLAKGRREQSGPYAAFARGIDTARTVRHSLADRPEESSDIWQRIDALAESRKAVR